MRFRSTRGASSDVDLSTALLNGLAPDGGLYLPVRVPHLGEEVIAAFRDRTVPQVATAVLTPFCEPSVKREVLEAVVDETFSFPMPLVELDGRTFVLELFHGPTLAFKDVGARFLARMLSVMRPPDAPLVVLTATSGDTGGAVADALHDVPGIGAVVLFPKGRVSPLQERQITTVGGNVRAVAVEGTFDDCQRLVKASFEDETLRKHMALTSANSINIGRLLPQLVYYFTGLARLPAAHRRVVVSVPSGNLGNLTAGLLAKRLGLPVHGFVAAMNVNAGIAGYLATGRTQPKPTTGTVSSAMDVGNPSNLERIISLYGGEHTALREDVTPFVCTDEATVACIAEMAAQGGYLFDPHSAVGMCGLREAMAQETDVVGLVLATAHPAKFPDIIEAAVGHEAPAPERLATVLDRPAEAVTISADPADLRALLVDTTAS